MGANAAFGSGERCRRLRGRRRPPWCPSGTPLSLCFCCVETECESLLTICCSGDCQCHYCRCRRRRRCCGGGGYCCGGCCCSDGFRTTTSAKHTTTTCSDAPWETRRVYSCRGRCCACSARARTCTALGPDPTIKQGVDGELQGVPAVEAERGDGGVQGGREAPHRSRGRGVGAHFSPATRPVGARARAARRGPLRPSRAGVRRGFGATRQRGRYSGDGGRALRGAVPVAGAPVAGAAGRGLTSPFLFPPSLI